MQSSYWISQNPSSKFPPHYSKFPNQLSSQDFILVYFCQMTKNHPKIYQLVVISVTKKSRFSKRSHLTFFAANLCLKIKYLWCQAHKYSEPAQNRVIWSQTQTSLTVLTPSGGNKVYVKQVLNFEITLVYTLLLFLRCL